MNGYEQLKPLAVYCNLGLENLRLELRILPTIKKYEIHNKI